MLKDYAPWDEKWAATFHNRGEYGVYVAAEQAVLFSRAGQRSDEPYTLAVKAMADATEMGLAPVPNLPAIRKTFDWVSEQNELRQSGQWLTQLGDYWEQQTWRAVQWPTITDADGYTTADIEVDPRDCRTAMCFAGKSVDNAGVQWLDNRDESYVKVTRDLLEEFPVLSTSYSVGETVAVDLMSNIVLGLHQAEGSTLYQAGNSFAVITDCLIPVFERAGEQLV